MAERERDLNVSTLEYGLRHSLEKKKEKTAGRTDTVNNSLRKHTLCLCVCLIRYSKIMSSQYRKEAS